MSNDRGTEANDCASSKCRIRLPENCNRLRLIRDTVRNYYKANGLDGYAKKRLQVKEGKQMEEDCVDSVCRHCDKPIEK